MVRSAILCCLAAMLMSSDARAQEADELPRWASISASEARLRAGAGQQFPVEWVYNRPGLPVKVIRTFQGWRLIEEPDGTQGWMYISLLNEGQGQRTAMVIGEGVAAMRESGAENAPLRWNLEPGVIGRLGECLQNWCELDVEGAKGWVAQDRLWGAGAP